MDILDILGCEHPIAEGAKAHIGDAGQGIKCLEAGIAFCMTMRHGEGDPRDWILDQAFLLEEAGFGGRFGMNYLHAGNNFKQQDMALIKQIKPRYVTISAAVMAPADFIRELHELGIMAGVLWGRTRLLQAHLRKLVGDAKPDFGVLEGFESAGHVGAEDTMTLMRDAAQILKAADIAVGVGGGIATNVRLQEVLEVADFGQIGSITVPTPHSCAHQEYLDRVIAPEAETIVTGGRWGHAVRALRSPFTERLLELENDPNTTEAQFMVAGTGSLVKGMLEGDWKNGTFPMGIVVDQLTEIHSVSKIVHNLLEEVA